MESATRCWQTPPDARYLLAKLKTFPWWSGARYGASYAKRVLARKLGLTPHLISWGPRYSELDHDVRSYPLWEVCTRQWIACVEAYEHSRQFLAPDQIVEIRYEDIVANPAAVLGQLCEQLKIRDRSRVIESARKHIIGQNVGKRSMMTNEQLKLVSELQAGLLERWGYQLGPATRNVA